MQKSTIITWSIIAIIVLAIVVPHFTPPLGGTPEQIRRRTLRSTPVGTSIEEVVQVIDDNSRWEWRGRHISSNGIPSHIVTGLVGGDSIGEQSISIVSRTRSFLIIPIFVEIFWGFDEDGYLIDVRVRRTTAI